MNFRELFENEHLLSVFHHVLMDQDKKNKVSKFSLKGEDYSYNQYSLLIVMDLVIKYQIIINDKSYNHLFIKMLESITSNYKEHQDLVIDGNGILIDLVAKKLCLDKNNNDAKREIVKYIYDRYIVEGYCFHSFPSVYKSKVEEEGLILDIDSVEVNELKKVNHIFSKHNYNDIISWDLIEKNRVLYITDSPAMAYYYAFRSPKYLFELTSFNKYYKNIDNYYKDAFYEKNYDWCLSNINKLCDHVKMTIKEKKTVLNVFNHRWNALNMSNSRPCIAFIKRSDLAKDSLFNIDELLDYVDKIDLAVLISKITDSKYPVIERYSSINSLNLMVVTMPSYREIKDNKFIDLNIKRNTGLVKFKKRGMFKYNTLDMVMIFLMILLTVALFIILFFSYSILGGLG